ncbi:MAG: GNAT family N-acetyltransferase [Alphaproteobacteria bacterium]|nr:GNAT family N-acetyltransferase [Alphaproteobacteria bacterium]
MGRRVGDGNGDGRGGTLEPAVPSDLQQIDLLPQHAAAGFALSSRIGWNQALPDWDYMLAAGEGVGLTASDEALIATAMALPYGGFAWICMVLVDPEYRRRGLATRLMDAVVARQVAAGCVPGLDATPDGREVYRRIGFRDHYGLGRYRAEQTDAAASSPSAQSEATIRPLEEGDLPALAAMDRGVFGGDRSQLLGHLLNRVPGVPHGAWRGGELAGYVLAREGREAHQVGPLVAEDPAVAMALARAALSRIEGPVYLDAPDAQGAFVAWLEASGFAQQRPFFRMYQNHDGGFDDPGRLFAIAGPELG